MMQTFAVKQILFVEQWHNISEQSTNWDLGPHLHQKSHQVVLCHSDCWLSLPPVVPLWISYGLLSTTACLTFPSVTGLHWLFCIGISFTRPSGRYSTTFHRNSTTLSCKHAKHTSHMNILNNTVIGTKLWGCKYCSSPSGSRSSTLVIVPFLPHSPQSTYCQSLSVTAYTVQAMAPKVFLSVCH